MDTGDNESISSDGITPRKSVKRAWKRLEVRSRSTCQSSQYLSCAQNERKWLATQLKFEFTEEERRSLFEQWNVATDAKERKIRLIRKLWSAETVRHGMPCHYEAFLHGWALQGAAGNGKERASRAEAAGKRRRRGRSTGSHFSSTVSWCVILRRLHVTSSSF